MLSKSVGSGPGKTPLYVTLEKATGKSPRWNFHKYLINRDGAVVDSFSSNTEPQGPVIVYAIEKALK